jgi:hypothetical protein
MKAFSLSLLSWLTLSGCAAAQNAYLYNLDIHPSTTSSSTSSSIDSETANAILGRRLGATESLKIGHIENVVLEHLNQYGGQQPISMFSDEGSPFVTSRVVIGIEGYDGTSNNGHANVRVFHVYLMVSRRAPASFTWRYDRKGQYRPCQHFLHGEFGEQKA